MRLLFLASSTAIGGAESYLLTIAVAARQAGWEVHVACPTDNVLLVNQLTSLGLRHHRLRSGFNWKNPLTLPSFATELIDCLGLLWFKVRPQAVVINLHWPQASFPSILACAFNRTPAAIVFHLFPQLPISARKQALYRWTKQRKQEWVTVSDDSRRTAMKSFALGENDVNVFYNGVQLPPALSETDRFAARQSVRRELNLPEDAYMVLTAARLSLQKDYASLIYSIPYVAAEFPNLRFVFAGDGELKDTILEQIRERQIEDRVLLLGHRSDVPRLLEACDLFVFPTMLEGCPFAIMEAMSHAVPIIAADLNPIKELITDKVEGLLYRTGDSCHLMEVLRWALVHPAEMKEMANSARQRSARFTQSEMISHILDLLGNISSKGPISSR